jgi:hypothetical protein
MAKAAGAPGAIQKESVEVPAASFACASMSKPKTAARKHP